MTLNMVEVFFVHIVNILGDGNFATTQSPNSASFVESDSFSLDISLSESMECRFCEEKFDGIEEKQQHCELLSHRYKVRKMDSNDGPYKYRQPPLSINGKFELCERLGERYACFHVFLIIIVSNIVSKLHQNNVAIF